jgi:putative tricarboxylic transport membrane protein
VFPTTIALAMIGLSTMLIVGNLRRPNVPGKSVFADGQSTPRRLGLAAVMLVWALSLTRAGFVLSSVAAFFLLLVIAEYERWTLRRAIGYALVGIGTVAFAYFLMRDVLLIPVPEGRLF